jgi:protein-L-isoaspartate(D-aspartate) O-methyltransferase
MILMIRHLWTYISTMGTATQKIAMIMRLRGGGIIDNGLLAAMERIPREHFVPQAFMDQAYLESALPIAAGQTTSEPHVIALMIQALDIQPRHKVLEIGTGSGWQTAILASLARRVYSIDIHKELVKYAEQRLQLVQCHNATIMHGDGHDGWPSQAPFDRIIVCAATSSIPQGLLQQLTKEGRLVIPLGDVRGIQELCLVTRQEDSFHEQRFGSARFVPLRSMKEVIG